MLDRHDRVAVTQMAAILRVAMAIWTTLVANCIHELSCEVCRRQPAGYFDSIGRRLVAGAVALRQNGELFEETFGMPVLLRMQRVKYRVFILQTGTPEVLAIRYDWRNNSVVVVHNLSATPREIWLKLDSDGSGCLANLLSGENSTPDASG